MIGGDGKPRKAKQQPRGDYEAGYAKTPEHTRFKPGNEIGKKGGRPKGRKNKATLLREILEFKIEMNLPGGASKRVTELEAATWKMATKAVGGDARAFAEIKQLANQVGIEISEPPPPDEVLSAEEEETLRQFLATIEAGALAKRASDARPSSSIVPVPHPAADRAPTVVAIPGKPTVRRVTFGPRDAVIRTGMNRREGSP